MSAGVRIAVTGASGFCGGHVASLAAARGPAWCAWAAGRVRWGNTAPGTRRTAHRT